VTDPSAPPKLPAQRVAQLQRLLRLLGAGEIPDLDWNLLDEALVHPSASPERNYQQLEFLGDSVLRLAASELLYELYPEATAGQYSAMRAVLVSDRVLAEIAASFGLGRYLQVGSGAENDRAGERSRLADAFEAVLGALYASAGTLEVVRPWLDPLLQERAETLRHDPTLENYKDALQGWTQGRYKCLPEYRVRENVPEQNAPDRFAADVWLRDRHLGSGVGRSKKAAEQAAARVAYEFVSAHPEAFEVSSAEEAT